jgi:hypothetical protein
MLSKILAGLLGVGLLVSGTAHASDRAASTVTISGVAVKAKWHESFVKGSVTFSGVETRAIELEASLRNVKTGRLISVKRFSVSGGSFTQSIKLSARPVPGTYRLRLREMPAGSAADRNVKIKAPPEGVVDRAYTSKTKNGAPVKVIRNAKIIYAHFHFVAAPRTKTLTFNWRKPGNPKVRFTGFAKKPYKTNVSTFVCVKTSGGGSCLNVELQTGKWYCIVYAGGKVVKRQVVTVT